MAVVSISDEREIQKVASYCSKPSLRIDQGQTDIFEPETSVVAVASFTSLPHSSRSCNDLLFLSEEFGFSWAIRQEEVSNWDHQQGRYPLD